MHHKEDIHGYKGTLHINQEISLSVFHVKGGCPTYHSRKVADTPGGYDPQSNTNMHASLVGVGGRTPLASRSIPMWRQVLDFALPPDRVSKWLYVCNSQTFIDPALGFFFNTPIPTQLTVHQTSGGYLDRY